MALQYALLGFLNLQPLTGYDLKKRLDISTQHFWYAGLNQIYPTLRSLEERDWIRSHLEPQEGKPDRKVYQITEDGRGALLDWLAEPLEALPRDRNVGLLKLFFAGFLETEAIVRQLRSQLELHRAQLEHYGQVRHVIQEFVERGDLRREGRLWELVRERGEEYERTYVAWLERAIAVVEQLE